MKKALPLITLLCYTVAVAGCIAHIICEVVPAISMLILFIAFVLGILVLMSFATASAIRDVKSILAGKNENVAFEGLTLKENTQSKDSPYSEDVNESVSSVFATEDAPEEEAVEEATSEAEAVEEAAVEEAAVEEAAVEEAAVEEPAVEEAAVEEPAVEEAAVEEEAVEEAAVEEAAVEEAAVEEAAVEEAAVEEAAVEEAATETEEEVAVEVKSDAKVDAIDTAEPEIIVVPLSVKTPKTLDVNDIDDDGDIDDDDIDDDDIDDDDDDDIDTAVEDNTDSSIAGKFKEARFIYPYTARVIQADDEVKNYYSTIKNAFMSYKKVTSTVSREHERFRRGRTTIGIAKLRGKTIILYLALDPAQFENTMFVGKDVSDIVKYTDVPFQYRVNGPRKASRAVKLIGMIAEKFGLEATNEPANEDYTALYPYESTEALIEKGIVIDKVAESAQKAEMARIAAEEAEKAAEKAIEDAIKAQQSATAAAEKAAEKAEIHAEDTETETENN